MAALVPNFANMRSDIHATDETDVSVDVCLDSGKCTNGSDDLGGVFQLTLSANAETLTTRELQYDVSAFGLKSALEELGNIGEVKVEKSTDPDSGFTWLITFSGCRYVDNEDVCNIGNVMELTYTNSLTGCASPTIEVTPIVQGNGPSSTQLVTDLSGGAPYRYNIENLVFGTAYYVRVYAHNSKGFGGIMKGYFR